MESPASIWLRSGRKLQYLFKGSRDELIQELKAWVERRKLKNQAHAKLCEEFTQNKESLMAIPQQPGSTQQKSTQISEIMNRFIEGVNSLRKLYDEKDAETLHGQFLIATINQRGIAQPEMPSLKPEQVDADICSILDLLDKMFDGRKELKILAELEAGARWQAERAANDVNHAEDIAQGLLPGVNPRAIGVVAAQARQEITKDPTLSMAQAMDIASDMHLGEGVIDMAMGRATPDTIAQMMEKIQVARDSAERTDASATAATKSTPTSAADPTTAATSAAITSTPDLAQHQSANPAKSKAKKKNDARKARKKALKEAAAAGNAGGVIEDVEGDEDVGVDGMD